MARPTLLLLSLSLSLSLLPSFAAAGGARLSSSASVLSMAAPDGAPTGTVAADDVASSISSSAHSQLEAERSMASQRVKECRDRLDAVRGEWGRQRSAAAAARREATLQRRRWEAMNAAPPAAEPLVVQLRIDADDARSDAAAALSAAADARAQFEEYQRDARATLDTLHRLKEDVEAGRGLFAPELDSFVAPASEDVRPAALLQTAAATTLRRARAEARALVAAHSTAQSRTRARARASREELAGVVAALIADVESALEHQRAELDASVDMYRGQAEAASARAAEAEQRGKIAQMEVDAELQHRRDAKEQADALAAKADASLAAVRALSSQRQQVSELCDHLIHEESVLDDKIQRQQHAIDVMQSLAGALSAAGNSADGSVLKEVYELLAATASTGPPPEEIKEMTGGATGVASSTGGAVEDASAVEEATGGAAVEEATATEGADSTGAAAVEEATGGAAAVEEATGGAAVGDATGGAVEETATTGGADSTAAAAAVDSTASTGAAEDASGGAPEATASSGATGDASEATASTGATGSAADATAAESSTGPALDSTAATGGAREATGAVSASDDETAVEQIVEEYGAAEAFRDLLSASTGHASGASGAREEAAPWDALADQLLQQQRRESLEAELSRVVNTHVGSETVVAADHAAVESRETTFLAKHAAKERTAAVVAEAAAKAAAEAEAQPPADSISDLFPFGMHVPEATGSGESETGATGATGGGETGATGGGETGATGGGETGATAGGETGATGVGVSSEGVAVADEDPRLAFCADVRKRYGEISATLDAQISELTNSRLPAAVESRRVAHEAVSGSTESAEHSKAKIASLKEQMAQQSSDREQEHERFLSRQQALEQFITMSASASKAFEADGAVSQDSVRFLSLSAERLHLRRSAASSSSSSSSSSSGASSAEQVRHMLQALHDDATAQLADLRLAESEQARAFDAFIADASSQVTALEAQLAQHGHESPSLVQAVEGAESELQKLRALHQSLAVRRISLDRDLAASQC